MTGMSTLPQHLQQRLRDELKPGESLVWVGQPNPNRFMRTGFILWFFFIPWTAFALYWMVGAAGFKWPRLENGWDLFPFFGLPFLLVGMGGLCSPFLLRRKAASIIYAISDQRALSIEGAKSITVKSYLPADMGNLEKTVHKDGSGNLILRTESYHDSDGDQRTRREGFFSIDDVRHVEHLLENLAKTGATFSATTF